MSEKVLRVQMFGGFSMYYGDDPVALNKIGSAKSIRLLQMLLLSLRGGIPKNELIENLYGWNEDADAMNRNRNLNNLIYRLRGQLISAGLPDDEYVEISEGRCRFKSSIPLELDALRFEETVRETQKYAGGGIKKLTYYREPVICTAASCFPEIRRKCGFSVRATTIRKCICKPFASWRMSIQY